MRELGDPRHPGRLVANLFLRPLATPSFGGFRQVWNPVYRCVTLFWFYRPLRQRLPRSLAVYITLLASGLLLHDILFNRSADVVHEHLPVPAVTLLFAIFGALTLLSEAGHLNLVGRPVWLRVVANLVSLALGFGIQRLVLTFITG